MAEFPLEPQLSKVLLTAPRYNILNEILTIVSCLNSPNIFLRPKDKMTEATDAHSKFISQDSDHLTLMNAFFEYKRNNYKIFLSSYNSLPYNKK
jgi:pre-mRNA-splicing factor ATP-dependent RNA helicase DHX15/PRP43